MSNTRIRSSNVSYWNSSSNYNANMPSIDYGFLENHLSKTASAEQEPIKDTEETCPVCGKKLSECMCATAEKCCPVCGNPESECTCGSHKEAVVVKDLRTAANSDEGYSLDNVEENKVPHDELEEKAKIPVPGLMVTYENNNSDMAPPTSDWVAPNGPFWGSNT